MTNRVDVIPLLYLRTMLCSIIFEQIKNIQNKFTMFSQFRFIAISAYLNFFVNCQCVQVFRKWSWNDLAWGRIFSQFENELVPSWEQGIWEKHWELVPSWEWARSQPDKKYGLRIFRMECLSDTFFYCFFVLIFYNFRPSEYNALLRIDLWGQPMG